MATKLQALFQTSAYDEAPVRNNEGAPAFIRSDEERLIQVLTTGTFENTFYVDAKALSQEATDLFKKFAKDDPKFLAQAILHARTEGFMRVVPITALVILSTATDKSSFRTIFPQVIQTPGDLQDFLTIIRTGKFRGMGKVVQKAVQDWLNNLSEYHVIKYGSESQTMSLRDMFRLARPTPVTEQQKSVAAYVVKGECDARTSQIDAYERFKTLAKEAPAQALKLVEQYKLPWEVVTSQVSGQDAWRALVKTLPYMALLRNLNNLLKYDALTVENLAYVTSVLSDPNRVAKSKQLPFRFYSALKAIADPPGYKRSQAQNTTAPYSAGFALAAALEDALNLSVANMPTLGGRVLVANDISGSMDSAPSAKSDMTMREIAGIFGAALFKKSESAEVVSFNETIVPRVLKRSDPLAVLAQQIGQGTGGTNLSAPVEYMLDRRHEQQWDTFIAITDNESWYDHLMSGRPGFSTFSLRSGTPQRVGGVMDRIQEYRKNVNPNLQCFFIQLQPYQTAQVRQDEPGVYYLYGWGGNVLPFIASIANGGQTQVEHVRSLEV